MTSRGLVAGISAAAAAAAIGAGAFWWHGQRRRAHAALPAPLIVFTDLEPDDMLALRVLHARKIQPKAVVVGEGCVEAKVARMRAYARKLGWTHTVVMQGLGSARTWPNDGHDIADEPVDHTSAPLCSPAALSAVMHGTPDSRPAGSCPVLPRLVSPCPVQQPTFLVLKPPRELVNWDAAEAAPLFSTVRLAAYGSFNFRQVNMNEVAAWLTPATTPFSSVVWYENFMGMLHGTKALTSAVMPPRQVATAAGAAATATAAPAEFDVCLRKVALDWDTYMLQDCEESCATIEADTFRADAAWARNTVCAQQIRAAMGQQIVAADPVLALVLDNPRFQIGHAEVQSVTVSPTEPYPKIQYGPCQGKVVKIEQLEDKSVLEDLAQVWHEVFAE